MPDLIHLLQFEADDVDRIAREYIRKRDDDESYYGATRGSVEASGLAHAIYEIYEKAKVRGIVADLRHAAKEREL